MQKLTKQEILEKITTEEYFDGGAVVPSMLASLLFSMDESIKKLEGKEEKIGNNWPGGFNAVATDSYIGAGGGKLVEETNPFSLSSPLPKGYKVVNANTFEPTPPEWEKEFDRRSADFNNSTDAVPLGCCGGDYCYGEHNKELKSFIWKLLKEEREKIQANLNKLLYGGKLDFTDINNYFNNK